MPTHLQYVLPLILVFATTVLAADKTAAEESFDATARAKTVGPVIDELTRVVAHVDLSRLQVEQSVAAFQKIVPAAAFEPERVRAELLALQVMFRKAGFRELYVIVSLEDMHGGTCFIVAPLPNGEASMPKKTKQLTAWLGKDRRHAMTLDRLGELAFIGTPQTLARLKTLKPTPRPELAETFAAAGDTDVQIVLLTNDDDRRLIEELYPTLPKWIGGGPSTVFTHGLRWAALGADFPPKPRLQLTIQSRDQESAKTLDGKIGELLALAETGALFDKPAENFPLLADAMRLAAFLKPTLAENRLEYTLGTKQGEMDALGKLMAAPLAESLNVIWRRQTVHKLKQLGLAMHNWHDRHKAFPAQANYDADGRPLLSWRVHILPQLAHLDLYRQFHLDEPWDSPHNLKLIEKMPDAYAMPNSPARHRGRTCFVRPVGEKTTCPGKEAVTIKDIADGTSNTIMIVEVDEKHAVVWTKPEDIIINPKQPANGLGGHFKDGFWTTFCDGSGRFISSSISPKSLRVFFTRNGGEPVNWSTIR